MNETKIQFSDPELGLMCNADIILTKNKIIQKIKHLLEDVQLQMMQDAAEKINPAVQALFINPPKISKGENYLGLPYLILDYPRNFYQNQTLAIRTMFWWGHFFSSTLHLSGASLLLVKENIADSYSLLASQHYFISVNEDPWQHHFNSDNYVEISTLSKTYFENILEVQPHIKIAAKWPLTEVHSAASLLLKSWSLLVEIMHPSHPGGETNLSPDGPKAGSGL